MLKERLLDFNSRQGVQRSLKQQLYENGLRVLGKKLRALFRQINKEL